MNCKTCGYRLWNIASRACPECGSAFVPSDFEFAPNEVQFVCPAAGCEQVYYGTSPTGHLVPPEFDCVQCGRHLTMNEMLLRPADWAREDRTGGLVNPWLERERRGRVGAFFAMIGWGMARPADLMRATPADSSMNQAWWYVVVSFLIYCLTGYVPLGIFMGIVAVAAASAGGGGSGAVIGMVTPIVSIFVAVLAWCAFVAIWGAVAHVCLLGGGPRSTIRRTFQALCYTCGPMCVIAVPCLGVYMLPPVGVIWWVISAVVAVKEAQQVSGGRAAFAVLAWPVVVTLGLIGLIVWLFVGLSAAFPGPQGGIGIGSLGFALQQHAMNDPNGQGPAHALELTVGQTWLLPDGFNDWSTNTTPSDVPVAGVDLDQYAQASASQQQAYLQQAAAALPANTVAHRVGDYVFTYHGMDLNNPPDPGLWLIVYHPDPDVNPSPGPNAHCSVYCADGSQQGFTFSQMATMLTLQNALRQQHGLPSLPDPATVTHAQPAAGP